MIKTAKSTEKQSTDSTWTSSYTNGTKNSIKVQTIQRRRSSLAWNKEYQLRGITSETKAKIRRTISYY